MNKISQNIIQNNRRTQWLDFARAIATLAVIIVHVSAPAVVLEFKTNANYWWIANFYNSISRFCVPVFVMITGALLFRQKMSLGDFLSKRLGRIIIPFLFWSLVYFIFNAMLQTRGPENFSNRSFLPWLGNQLLYGTSVHLWYMYMIIGLYFIIPVIQPWITSIKSSSIIYFLVIWVFVSAIIQFGHNDYIEFLNIKFFGGYLGYAVLGYFISNRLRISKGVKTAGLLCLIAGFAMTFFGTYFLAKAEGEFSHLFYEFLSVNVILASGGIFVLCKAWKNISETSAAFKLIKLISSYGLGIYLSHFILLVIMNFLGINYHTINPAISIPVVSIVCLAFSTLLIFIMRTVSYGKYISG